MTTTRKFRFGGRIESVTHAWRTHPALPGSARFSWIFRACQVVETDGDIAVIRLVGLESRPTRKVAAAELVELPAKGIALAFNLDA